MIRATTRKGRELNIAAEVELARKNSQKIFNKFLIYHKNTSFDFENQCLHIAKGQIKGDGCYCELLKKFINPWAQKCVMGTVEEGMGMSTLPGPVTSPCPEQTENTLTSDEVEQLCTNPAKYLCSRENNSEALDAMSRAKRELQQIHNAVADKATKKYREDNGLESCSSGLVEKWKECNAIEREAVAKVLYTHERTEKAKKIFEDAKSAMLMKLRKDFRNAPAYSKSRERGLKKIIDLIEKTQLHFGVSKESDKITFNASVSDYKPLTVKKQPTIIIQGMITLVDYSPDSLYFILLHEMSHLFAPCSFEDSRYEPYYESHPFKRELQCLHRDDSIGAKRADIACYKKAEAEAKRLGVEIPYGLGVSLGFYSDKKSNCAAVSYFDRWPEKVRQSPDCAVPQINEAFADWYTSEIIGDSLGNQKPNVVIEKLKQYVGWICQGVEFTNSREERHQLREKHGSYTHPLEEDRINATIMAYPMIKHALGCSAKDHVVNLRKLDSDAYEEIDQRNPKSGENRKPRSVYCGGHLYLPFGVSK